jgi:hypothetical protein
LFVLAGCALPRRFHTGGSRLSVQVLLDLRNQEWIDNIREMRCYLYPIHNSRSFLVTSSLASSLYLMLMYFTTGGYQNVNKMMESCVSGVDPRRGELELFFSDRSPLVNAISLFELLYFLLSSQQQIINQLEFLGHDYHPDAHASRLKLSVLTVGLGEESTMKCPLECCRRHGGACEETRLCIFCLQADNRRGDSSHATLQAGFHRKAVPYPTQPESCCHCR